MEIRQESVKGLKHKYSVTVDAEYIESKVKSEILETGKRVKLAGFRPGKAPFHVLQQRYEASVRPDVIKDVLQETVQKVLKDNNLKAAAQPNLSITSYENGKNLECSIELETLPEIGDVDLSKIKAESFKCIVDDKRVTEQLETIADRQKSTKPLDKPRASKTGDTLLMDFDGRTEDGPIAGGSAKKYYLELGSGSFIPGFEDQLIGLNAGDKKTVELSFPKDYQAKDLAGKKATFEVKVHEVLETSAPVLDDAFAKSIGFEKIDQVKKLLSDSLQNENDRAAFILTKKQILDGLDKTKIELPETLVETEFQQIWNEHLHSDCDHAHGNCSHEDEGTETKGKKSEKKTDPAEEKEYRTIAERRVRLGLLLAAVGNKNSVTVTPQELEQALIQEARKYPGQEKKVVEFYRSNGNAMQSLRAPIFEDKVIRWIIESLKLPTKEISQKELDKAFKDLTEDSGA